MNIKKIIIKYFWWTYRPIKYILNDVRMKKEADRLTMLTNSQKRIFYLGITAQPNLGDMAQHYCIKNWINDNYPDYELVMFEAAPVVYKRHGFLDSLAKIYKPEDRIVFQSGYCTQDLGGNHPLMHRMVIDAIPEAKILMMPQTIFFEHEENKLICAENHNKAKNMLFLARDFVSYEMAKKMFTEIKVMAYPDIVTTLIGTLSFNNERNGACLCTRNDGEKLYTDAQLQELAAKIEATGTPVLKKDTQGKAPYREIRENLQLFIEKEIESYSFYEVTITDRYHGTIFSLCAGTPVIIIKTKDHKVTTGADWFKGIYDDYVYVADDLNDAYRIFVEIRNKKNNHKLLPHMKQEYYDRLKENFEKN